MSTERKRDDIPEIEVTPEMVEAGLAAMEPFRFTSFDGYEMLPALEAAFKAMINRYREPH